MNIDVVSASAGTGKTYRLTGDLLGALLGGTAPEGVVAITYTVKAAGELESRTRERLLKERRPDLAARVRDGYFGTIHSVCQRLLREFALDAGISPWLEPIPEPERKRMFDVALASVLAGREGELNELGRRLELPEWKESLLAIVDAARANGMDAPAVARSAAASRAGLEALLGEPTVDTATYRRDLQKTLRPLHRKLEELAAATPQQAAKDRAAAARRLVADLDRGLMPSWKGQLQLAQKVGIGDLRTWADPYAQLAARHHASAGFHDDVLAMQAALFALAGEALGVFVAEKTAAGVVDFGDMLARAREVLDVPSVRQALGARLELVLVDEFQDTSPLQLAVVSALAGLARRSIWVGDRKQAIFAFQGTDPELMTAATQAALGGRAPEILGKSWRSRPDLVAMTSELFVRALAPHGFPEEQVRVTAKPEHPKLLEQHALECWRWSKVKAVVGAEKVSPNEANALAAGVAALLADPPLVRERSSEDPEPVRRASRRDVAILARSNARCRDIAEALRTRGIPARVALSGVTLTPEGELARAALALLADPRDGVAAREVAWRSGAPRGDPDAWLSRRLLEVSAWRAAVEAARQKGERGPPEPLAFDDDARVAELREAGQAAERLSPAQALDLALRAAGVPELARAWPEPAQRLANLEALRAEAAAYEQLCGAQRTAATMLGLVAHLGSLGGDAEAGKQAAPSSEDAVTVLTWHRAKGLEWPIVVLSQLDNDRRRNVFDVAVEAAPAFDFARPLDGRWVRWWPWPYGGMSKGLALLDAASKTPESVRATDADRRERLRLLYVGFTRPRDLLVLVAGCNKGGDPSTAALQLLVDADGKSLLEAPFDARDGAAKLAVAGEAWRCKVREVSGLLPTARPPSAGAVRWYAAAPRVERPRERLNPSAEPLDGTAHIVRVDRLGGRQALDAAPEQAGAVGDALHAFLAADRPAPAEARTAMARRILRAHGVAGAVAPATLLDASDALRARLDARYPGAAWFREWPVRARLAGPHPRLLVGEVDLFLDLPDGFVLVDHKSFPGGERERDRRLVEEYAPQLGWYARVLADALRKPMKAAFIHLPIRGELAEVGL